MFFSFKFSVRYHFDLLDVATVAVIRHKRLCASWQRLHRMTSRMKSKIATRGLELLRHSFPLQNLNTGIDYIVDSIQSVVLFGAGISSFALAIVYPVFVGGVLVNHM